LNDHQNGEYYFMAHFKKGTITVKAGDKVATGQILGNCGNSENTSEPHLHYQLQNQAGECLTAQFHNYVVDGVAMESDELVRGQQIRAKQ
jgi:murein DD-endopeptidase MepM/ murein hydrolase activator NlpD